MITKLVLEAVRTNRVASILRDYKLCFPTGLFVWILDDRCRKKYCKSLNLKMDYIFITNLVLEAVRTY